jgi:molecular chaperone Hsp33
MGAEEIREIISEQGSIKAECQFCAEQYEFFKEDLDSDLGDQAQTH